MDKIAELEGASKQFKNGDQMITALEPCHLKVYSNQLLLILGPSGSGKTTLLSLLGCVIYPSAGEVRVLGQSTSDLSPRALAHLRLQHIGFIFQHFNLIAPLSAEQNIQLPLRLSGTPWSEIRKRSEWALELVGMQHRRKSLPKMLSGGEQQRIAIARALVTDAPMLLCDEPTASLDARSAHTVMEELKTLSKQGKAVVIVTHDERLLPYADDVVQVKDGRIQENSESNRSL